MSAPSPLYSGGGFLVTASLFRTPRRTYALGHLQYVSVQQPLLQFVGLPSLGLLIFGLSFQRLFPAELIALVAGTVAAIAASALIGTLRVHSIALRDEDVSRSFGSIFRLRAVRAAVEEAMGASAVRLGAQ